MDEKVKVITNSKTTSGHKFKARSRIMSSLEEKDMQKK